MVRQCQEAKDHYTINQLWMYKKFSLNLTKIDASAEWGSRVRLHLEAIVGDADDGRTDRKRRRSSPPPPPPQQQPAIRVKLKLNKSESESAVGHS